MLIAKIENGQVTNVADYTAMFPNTSFPPSGPNADFMIQNSCMYVNVYLPYDPTVQKLVPATPYIQVDDPAQPLNWVYTVRVEPLTPEEIEQMRQNEAAQIGQQAANLLSQTDWSAIPSVADPAQSNPYLTNQAEFITWRSQVRAIAVNPKYDSVIPPQPKDKWSS